MFSMADLHGLIMTIVYSVIGLLVFTGFWVFVVKVAPFPVIKEIEEDQNIALGLLLGSVMIGLSIIIAAAIF